ncbi:hypothetical protein [Aequorivita sp. CIP111184]|uniref:hypothetical protein n=1 Tax=Aequorivita sp. CIP111184 TaxID=2211356 RepID=UPI0015EC7118|nr:hypothetical protein [Aequorivita sp. CIP111184]
MKNLIPLLITIIISLNAIGQNDYTKRGALSSGAANGNFDIFYRTVELNQKSLAFGLTEAEFNSIKEKAYANPNFIVGNIYQDENLLKAGVPMRYNAYADEIEIKNHASEENYGALMKDESIYAKIGKDIYVFIPYNGSNEKGGYFNILADGKNYDLYKKTTANFIEPKKGKTNYETDSAATFDKTIKYYLVQNGKFLEMPSTKSKVLKVMNSKKKEIKGYIDKNNLDVDKELDLIKVFTYFDSLL